MAVEGAFKLDRAAPGMLAVSGVLSFDTAATALQALDDALRVGDRSQLDLGGVNACDSAGLACVLAVLAGARRHGKAVGLRNVPEGLRTLAQVSGVEFLLPAV